MSHEILAAVHAKKFAEGGGEEEKHSDASWMGCKGRVLPESFGATINHHCIRKTIQRGFGSRYIYTFTSTRGGNRE